MSGPWDVAICDPSLGCNWTRLSPNEVHHFLSTSGGSICLQHPVILLKAKQGGKKKKKNHWFLRPSLLFLSIRRWAKQSAQYPGTVLSIHQTIRPRLNSPSAHRKPCRIPTAVGLCLQIWGKRRTPVTCSLLLGRGLHGDTFWTGERMLLVRLHHPHYCSIELHLQNTRLKVNY